MNSYMPAEVYRRQIEVLEAPGNRSKKHLRQSATDAGMECAKQRLYDLTTVDLVPAARVALDEAIEAIRSYQYA
jgi:hypothetical protein